MNIFFSSPEPCKCAVVLDDKRVIKMILESAQIMSTAAVYHKMRKHERKKYQWKNKKCRDLYAMSMGIYKPTHMNHPCVKWAIKDRQNYRWLWMHFNSLCEEYARRFNKRHKCEDISNKLLVYSDLIPLFNGAEGFCIPPNCTTYKHIKSTSLAYKAYLQDKWKNDKRPPKWTNRRRPAWVKRK